MPQRVVIPGGFVQVPPTRLILPGGFTQVPFRPVLGGVAKMNPATFVGPLDAYAADLQVALLPFRGFTAYAGQWCRIRESGSDTESDIGYLANGQPDTAAWSAFVGANDGFLRTWYDQSGGARDSVQATNATQLQSVLNIVNSYPVARIDGVDDNSASSGLDSGAATGRTLYVVTKKRSAPVHPGVMPVVSLTTSARILSDNNGTPDLSGGWGYLSGISTQTVLGGVVTDWTLISVTLGSSGNAAFFLNNNASATPAINSAFRTSTSLTLGAGSFVADNDIAAVIVYNAPHDDATREAIQSILAARFGITLAP